MFGESERFSIQSLGVAPESLRPMVKSQVQVYTYPHVVSFCCIIAYNRFEFFTVLALPQHKPSPPLALILLS